MGPHALSTIWVATLGFSASVAFAFTASVALHFSPWLQRGLMPLLVASQTIPLVALAPLMILWFGFGLLPGLGIAKDLMDFGLDGAYFVPKLVGFNVGVEIGQLAVIAAVWLTLNFLFDRFEWYQRRIAAPVSVAVAVIAAFWALERTGFVGNEGSWAFFSALTEGGYNPIWVTATAFVVASGLAGIRMLSVTLGKVRELVGILTSFLMFLLIIAAFTSGAWIMCVIIAVAWTLALKAQSFGGPGEAVA